MHRIQLVSASFLLVLAAASMARAATRTVGSGKQFPAPCAAIAAAEPNDVIEIDAATYAGDMCAVDKNGLTLRGVGGRAVIDGQGGGFGGKAIWVITADDVTIENVELTHAAVPDENGAGIRQEGKNLTVRGSFFHDSQNGILAGDKADSTIVIDGCEFARNGAGDGQSHNMYINHVKRFELRHSYTHDASIGHLVKSRALENVIAYNRISGESGTDSYEIDLPNAGLSYVIGNVVEQGPNTDNPALLSYGTESDGRNPIHDLYVVNNTMVNHRPNGGTFVRIDAAMSDGVAKIVNNVFAGPGTVTDRANATLAGNCEGEAGFVDEPGFDFHLTATSPCKDHGVDPGSAGSVSLLPVEQYVHPLGFEGRVAVGTIDSGAFELGGGVPPGSSSGGPSGSSGTGTSGSSGGATSSGSAGPGTDAGGSSGTTAEGDAAADDGGCGCHTTTARSFGSMSLLLALTLLMRRRMR